MTTRAARLPADVLRVHRPLKPTLWTLLKAAHPLALLTAPLVYSALIPLAVIDVWMTLFQWVCFPIYGIRRVKRRDYLIIDHQRLAYLHAIEKIHCVYCGYANGVIAYVREIAARTEQYWCPIKHERPIVAPHSRYHLFTEYGDGLGYREDLDGLRRSLSEEREDRRER